MLNYILNLFVNADGGKPSHTKFFSSVGYVITSWVIVYLSIHDKITADFLFTYLGIVSAHTGFSKWVNSKQPKIEETENVNAK